jgi:hypothetical protein
MRLQPEAVSEGQAAAAETHRWADRMIENSEFLPGFSPAMATIGFLASNRTCLNACLPCRLA